MRRLTAIFPLCATLSGTPVAFPAWADAITLDCAYKRYNPDGEPIGSGVDRITVDFDRQQWMVTSRPKFLYRLYAADDDKITLLLREGQPGIQVYDSIDRKDNSYQILHLSNNPAFYRDKEGTCTKAQFIPLPAKRFQVQEYKG